MYNELADKIDNLLSVKAPLLGMTNALKLHTKDGSDLHRWGYQALFIGKDEAIGLIKVLENISIPLSDQDSRALVVDLLARSTITDML